MVLEGLDDVMLLITFVFFFFYLFICDYESHVILVVSFFILFLICPRFPRVTFHRWRDSSYGNCFSDTHTRSGINPVYTLLWTYSSV